MKALVDPRIVRFERSPGAPSLFDAYDASGQLIWHSFDFVELASIEDRAEQAEIERNEAREQLAAAVLVLKALEVKLAEPFTDLDGTKVGPAVIAEKSDVEGSEQPSVIASFAKIAHLVKP